MGMKEGTLPSHDAPDLQAFTAQQTGAAGGSSASTGLGQATVLPEAGSSGEGKTATKSRFTEEGGEILEDGTVMCVFSFMLL